MKRGAVLVLASVLVAAGCRTTITMKPTEFAVGSGVDPRSGALRGEGDTFRVSDAEAVAWVEFENAHGAYPVRFRWINPEDRVVQDSGPLRVAPDDQLYRVRRAWSVLPIRGAPAELMPGRWKVEFWFRGEEVETLKFRIKD